MRKTVEHMIVPLLLSAACMTACVEETINFKYKEELKDLSPSLVTVQGSRSAGDVVSLELEEGNSFTDELYARSNAASAFDAFVTLGQSESRARAYIAAHPSQPVKVIDDQGQVEFVTYEKQVLPERYCTFTDGNLITLTSGQQRSEAKLVTVSTVDRLGNSLEPGRYVLALRAENGGREQYLYYELYVPVPRISRQYSLHTGDDLFTVCYVNVSEYDPRIVTDYVFTKSRQHSGDMEWTEPLWSGSIGNIVNLRSASVRYSEEDGDAVLSPSPDLKYILDRYDKYILPLQRSGRKVCLTLEGGKTGLGFCNMSPEQVTSFVAQVRTFLDRYPLDGINLWDRNAAYDKAEERSLPAPGTTSYPLLISRLSAALKPGSLLTLADEGEPTASFHDTEATGGISVGRYLDYAWNANAAHYGNVVDPYHQGQPGVSEQFPRHPIAGLAPERYGCVFYTIAPDEFSFEANDAAQNVSSWRNSGLKNNNMIVVNDLQTSLQNYNENSLPNIGGFFMYWDNDGIMYDFHKNELRFGGSDGGYNEWAKDW